VPAAGGETIYFDHTRHASQENRSDNAYHKDSIASIGNDLLPNLSVSEAVTIAKFQIAGGYGNRLRQKKHNSKPLNTIHKSCINHLSNYRQIISSLTQS
jgi:hypothetical protein